MVILPANTMQLTNLKDILQSFATSTVLKVNFAKLFLVPITLGCQLGTMSLKYLGLPLGTTRHSVQEFMPILRT